MAFFNTTILISDCEFEGPPQVHGYTTVKMEESKYHYFSNKAMLAVYNYNPGNFGLYCNVGHILWSLPGSMLLNGLVTMAGKIYKFQSPPGQLSGESQLGRASTTSLIM